MRLIITTLLFSAVSAVDINYAFANESVSDLLDVPTAELTDKQALAEEQNAALDRLLSELSPELGSKLAATDKTDAAEPGSKPKKKTRKKKSSSAARAGESSTSKIPAAVPDPLMAQEKLEAVKASMTQGVPRSETRRDLTELVGAYPDYEEARLLLGREQIANSELDAALSNLAPLLKPTNPDWQPWFWVATAYLAKGDLESTKQHLERAASKNSRVCALWIQLSVLYQELGEHSSALQYLHIAEQIDANNGLLHFNRAYSLEQLGRPAEARRAYQRFLISDIEPAAGDLRVIALQRIDTLSQGVEVANRGRR